MHISMPYAQYNHKTVWCFDITVHALFLEQWQWPEPGQTSSAKFYSGSSLSTTSCEAHTNSITDPISDTDILHKYYNWTTVVMLIVMSPACFLCVKALIFSCVFSCCLLYYGWWYLVLKLQNRNFQQLACQTLPGTLSCIASLQYNRWNLNITR